MRKKRIQIMIASGNGSDQRSSAWFCSLLCYCMSKYPCSCNFCPLPLTKYPLQHRVQHKTYIIWFLLNVDNICYLLRMTWRKTKSVTHDLPSLNLYSIFLLKNHTQNHHATSLKKRKGSCEVCTTTLLKYHKIGLSILKRVAPTTLLKLPQDWAIRIRNIAFY